jgi:hypothetical protein
MLSPRELSEYMAQVRKDVCSRCIDRPPGGPPCAPQGKTCGIEEHLEEVVELTHAVRSGEMEPYIEHFHQDVCSHCLARPTKNCPCPLDHLLILAIQAIETVDERRLPPQTAAE